MFTLTGYEVAGPFIEKETGETVRLSHPQYKHSSKGLYQRSTQANYNIFLQLLTYGHGLIDPNEKHRLVSALTMSVQELSLIETAVSNIQLLSFVCELIEWHFLIFSDCSRIERGDHYPWPARCEGSRCTRPQVPKDLQQPSDCEQCYAV